MFKCLIVNVLLFDGDILHIFAYISILMFVKLGNYKSMHHHLNLLRAYCNQLALRLVQKEYEENQLSIQNQGSLLYGNVSIDSEHTLIHPQLHLYASEDKTNIKA
jgi:hypothetical protein